MFRILLQEKPHQEILLPTDERTAAETEECFLVLFSYNEFYIQYVDINNH